MKNQMIINILIIIIILSIGLFIIFRGGHSEESTAKCIGEKTKIYVKTGCPVCRRQEGVFGDNLKYLELIDCAVEPDKCIDDGIKLVPSWIINGNIYEGYKSIDELKKLTGC